MKKRLIENNQKKRNEIKEIMVISIFLALAINIIVYGFCDLFKECGKKGWFFICVGVALLSVIGIIFWINQKVKATQKIKINGMVLFDDEKRIMEIPKYKISESMNRYLSSAFSEKKALINQWEKPDEKNFSPVNKWLIIELIQYCILEKLSICLTDYFESNKNKKLHLKKYEIKDIPQVLLNNHFLKLFTEPMEDREAFASMNQPSKPNGKIISAYTSEGAIYELFELYLPDKTKITMPNKNTICLDMKYIVVKYEIIFDGYGTVVDYDFYKYYLNNNFKYKDIACEFYINFTTIIKKPLLIGRKIVAYYNWIDLFLDAMDDYISVDSFYNKIGWNELKAQIRVLNNIIQNKSDDNQKV